MIINTSGVAIRINVSDISVTSRATMGVRLMKTGEEETIVAIAKISNTGEKEKDEQLTIDNIASNEVAVEVKDNSLDLLLEESEKEE